LTGGGKNLKKLIKSRGYLSKILNNLKYFPQLFTKKVKNFYKKLTFAAYDRTGKEGARATRRFCNLLSLIREFRTDLKFNLLNSKGSILIEFAVCMPVLIILLFYIHDLSKLKRYYDQTEFVAQQFVNIIQNISQKREDKKIKIDDIKHAATLAYLSMYPGTTMYRVGKAEARHILSHAPRLNIFCVKGEEGGKASCRWVKRFLGENMDTPKDWNHAANAGSDALTTVHTNVNVEPSYIHPKLKIEKDEVKVIVEVNLFNASHVMNPNDYVESDKQETLAKKAFKCLLAIPKPLMKNANDTGGWYFDTVVVFTPKPGLFDPDNPPPVGT